MICFATKIPCRFYFIYIQAFVHFPLITILENHQNALFSRHAYLSLILVFIFYLDTQIAQTTIRYEIFE
jgi:hypothetical protein